MIVKYLNKTEKRKNTLYCFRNRRQILLLKSQLFLKQYTNTVKGMKQSKDLLSYSSVKVASLFFFREKHCSKKKL